MECHLQGHLSRASPQNCPPGKNAIRSSLSRLDARSNQLEWVAGGRDDCRHIESYYSALAVMVSSCRCRCTRKHLQQGPSWSLSPPQMHLLCSQCCCSHLEAAPTARHSHVTGCHHCDSNVLLLCAITQVVSRMIMFTVQFGTCSKPTWRILAQQPYRRPKVLNLSGAFS